jgi:hypothetical protein
MVDSIDIPRYASHISSASVLPHPRHCTTIHVNHRTAKDQSTRICLTEDVHPGTRRTVCTRRACYATLNGAAKKRAAPPSAGHGNGRMAAAHAQASDKTKKTGAFKKDHQTDFIRGVARWRVRSTALAGRTCSFTRRVQACTPGGHHQAAMRRLSTDRSVRKRMHGARFLWFLYDRMWDDWIPFVCKKAFPPHLVWHSLSLTVLTCYGIHYL